MLPEAFSRHTYVAGINNTYLGLHVKCPIFVFDFNHIWSFSREFHKRLHFKISQ